MVRIVHLAVVCLCIVHVTLADGPAVVREVFAIEHEVNSSTPLEYHVVRSQEYEVEGESALQWIASLATQLPALNGNVSSECASDLRVYKKALLEGKVWASKIFDSNGRYGSSFLFANNFWLGSKEQCLDLQTPVFNVSFRIAKLLVNLHHITPRTREILLGQCQPSSCSVEDSRSLLSYLIQYPPNGSSIQIDHIRPVPGPYRILQDRRFQALTGTIIVVFCLVVLGSIYEYMHSKDPHCHKDLEHSGESNNGFEKDVNDKKENEKNPQETNNNLGDDKRVNKEKQLNSTGKRGKAIEALLAFSAISNGRKILTVSCNAEGSLKSIHGLRFFSLSWVILVHTYLQLFDIGGNKMMRVVTERSFMFQTVSNATFSVDTFFFISGLLMVYLYDRLERKSSNTKDASVVVIVLKFLKMLIYRFARLTPAYLVVLGAVQLAMAFIHNSSVFEPRVMDHYNCENYWWRNILYINNFFPRSEMCMLWSWYLATDTQFFTLSAIILIAARKRFKVAAGTLVGILVCAWCTTAVISYTIQYQARIQEPFASFDELYDKPWTRIGPYIVGMGTGWLLNRIDLSNRMPLPVVFLGWGLSCAALLSLVYGLGSGLNVALSAVYSALGHTTWGLSLAWIVIACHTGRGGVVNSILSNPVLYPLSRLTFCAYLVHPLIMFLTSYVMDGSFHIHNGMVVIIFLGNTVASFLLAFLISLGFEAPVVRLLKLLYK